MTTTIRTYPAFDSAQLARLATLKDTLITREAAYLLVLQDNITRRQVTA